MRQKIHLKGKLFTHKKNGLPKIEGRFLKKSPETIELPHV